MWPCMLVHQNWFLCDSDDAAKFRCSRTEIWGTFPSEVPISKKASNPTCQAENSPLSSWMGTFQKSRGIQRFFQDMGVICSHRICDFRDQKMGLIKNCVKEQVISGPKKTMWKKLGPRSQKCLFWFNVGLKSKPPSIWSLEISQKSMKTRYKVIK